MPGRAESARLRVTFWGVRGSVPSPGPATARFGGNTPCVEVEGGRSGARVFLDAGTGLRRAGGTHRSTLGSEVDLFLTHVHWDHIQGLPFFSSLHDPEAVVRIHAPADGLGEPRNLIAGQMDGVRFPVRFDELPASTCVREVHTPGLWRRNGLVVEPFPANHPGPTVGYRVRAEGASLAYFPDNAVGADSGHEPGWYDRLVDFLRGADLLIHDATYSEAEYPARRTWGHSTPEQALRLALDAGVGMLSLFHHDPERPDDDLERDVHRLRALAREAGSPLRVAAAAEGLSIDL